MMGKTIHINGINFTSYFTPWGYTVSYEKIQGGNQGTMKDGSFMDDVLAIKAIVEAVCMPLTDQQMTKLSNVLYQDTYPVIRYYDIKTGLYRQVFSTAILSPATERGIGSDGNIRWTGASVTLREK